MIAQLPNTIRYPNTFAAMSAPWADGVFHWGWLQRPFAGTKITPTDIDGVVERFGHIMMVETKIPGKEIPRGQMILMERLHSLRHVSIFFIWGKETPTERMLWRSIISGGRRDPERLPTNEAECEGIVKAWLRWVEQHKLAQDPREPLLKIAQDSFPF